MHLYDINRRKILVGGPILAACIIFVGVSVAVRPSAARDLLPTGSSPVSTGPTQVLPDVPASWTIEKLVDAAAKTGVTLRHPGVFAVPGTDINANIRLSLIAPRSDDDLRLGLQKVADLIRSRQ